MRILKLKGKNESFVMSQIREQYGDKAVIISKEQEQLGRFKWFKSPKTIVTIAVEDEEDVQDEVKSFKQEIKLAEEDFRREDKIDHTSYDVLMGLQQQMSLMQETLMSINHEQNNKVQEKEEFDSRLLSLLKDKLIELGISEALCDSILSEVTSNDEVEEAVRKIYYQIESILAKYETQEDLPQVIFFIGATGVGKTTTIAKLTAKYVLDEHKKVVLFTSDTYRIAAIEQLKTYAEILGVEIEVIYDEADIPRLIEKWSHMDHIFIDTAGRSHKNMEQVKELKELMHQVVVKRIFLTINASTAAKDVRKIISTYDEVKEVTHLIITKLDETDEVGNVLNIVEQAKVPVAYVTHGQNVPADIEAFSSEKYTVDLLGRINYE